ncbi:hypothetical protein [uncultured Campylobacter sp.]|uniref:hypothetical protein n=1 Tax=uncultured Campylobacter sp. TaxID=218934 RepID=UPI002605ADB6|nr:hypothetical protein [uncultured Campylobacter sp.]
MKFDLCFADTLRGKAVFDKSLLERAGRRALASCIMSKILPTAGGTSGLNLINLVCAGAVKFTGSRAARNRIKFYVATLQGLNLRRRVKFRQTTL